MENVVNYNAGEQTVTFYTKDKAIMYRLDRLVASYPEIHKLVSQTDINRTYFMPKSYVNFRKPRTVSMEQRELARQRMAKINSSGN